MDLKSLRPNILKSAIACIGVFAIWITLEIILQMVLQVLQVNNIKYLGISTSLIFSMLNFVFVCAIALFFLKSLYRIKIIQLIKGFASNGVTLWYWGFGLWFAVMVLLTVILKLFHATDWQWTYSSSSWWLAVVFWVIMLPAQTLFEELMFRFWLPDLFNFSKHFQNWAYVISALVFALLHSGNEEFSVYSWYWILLYYFIFGLFFAFLKLKSGSIVLPWSVHFAHNLSVILFVQYPHASIKSPTLWTSQTDESLSVSFLASMALMLIVYLPFKKFCFKPIQNTNP